MTNYEIIKAMSIVDLAGFNVRPTQDMMYYETSDEETFVIYDEAVAHEIEWLKSEV